MNEAEKQQLSREVAALYKIHPFRIAYIQEYDDLFDCFRLMPVEIWLADDGATLFDLCAEEGIELAYTKQIAVAIYHERNRVQEPFHLHNNKPQAARIAAMKALKAKKEG